MLGGVDDRRRLVAGPGGEVERIRKGTGAEDGYSGFSEVDLASGERGATRLGALLDAALAALAASGSSEASLWVLEDNARARRFYEARGWRADGAARPWHTDLPLVEVRYRWSSSERADA